MSLFQPLPGFRDFYPPDCAIRNYIFDKFRSTARSFGFEEYDAPTLEPIELFTAKAGEEIVDQLFNFQDKGGRHIALRPEMTPSLARMIGSQANSMKRPIKWFNISETFRYERPQKGRLRSFYQMNADVFGDNSYGADGELIALAIQILKNFGLTHKDFHIRLSDRTLWMLFLQSNKITNVCAVLNIIDKIERESPDIVIAKLDAIECIAGKVLFEKIQSFKAIVELGELRKFFATSDISSDAAVSRIKKFSDLLERIDSFGLSDFVTIDFGIVRGLAYYTGFVFEIFERNGQSRALAGGGRYDDLVGKLRYSNLQATGFAIGDVTLTNLLNEKNLIPKFSREIDCFVVFSENAKHCAMQQIMYLRERGIVVNYCFETIGIGKQLSTAAQIGAKYAIIIGEEEIYANVIKLKNLSTREERVIPINQIAKAILDEFKK